MTPPIPCVRADFITVFCEMVQGGLAAVVDGAALAIVGVAMASRVPAPRTRVAPRPHRLCAVFIGSSLTADIQAVRGSEQYGTEAKHTIWAERQQLRQILMKLTLVCSLGPRTKSPRGPDIRV